MFSNNSGSNIIASWWKRLPLPLRLKIVGIGAAVIASAFMLIMLIATVYNLFHGGFSTITGSEPVAGEISKEDKNNGIEQSIEGFDGDEVVPGEDNANKIYDSQYNEDGSLNIGGGLEVLDEYEKCDLSLKNWLIEFFTDRLTTACSVVKAINEEAEKKEEEFVDYELEIDRGLIISTFIYAYANSTAHEQNEADGISAADPFTILKYLVEKTTQDGDDEQAMLINVKEIKKLIEAQILIENYVSLSWGVVGTDDQYTTHEYSCPTEDDKDKMCCENVFVETITSYKACTSKETFDVKFSLDKYKMFLRDMSYAGIEGATYLGGWGPQTEDSSYVQAYNSSDLPYMKYDTTFKKAGLHGFTGANSYDLTKKTTSRECDDTEPSLGAKEALASKNQDFFDYGTCDGTVNKGSSQYVTKDEAHNFMKTTINDYKRDNKDVFNTAADYTDLTKTDNLSFTYSNTSFKVNYDKGFIVENFDYVREEEKESYRYKEVERTIAIIVNNAEAMNKALNFKYSEEDMVAVNSAVVIGNEAAVLGDYDFQVSSPFGNRWHPIRHEWHHHDGVDLAGWDIGGKGIYAWKDGTVIYNGYWGSGGWTIMIQHESLEGKKVVSYYLHMRYQSLLPVGQKVDAGTLVGYVGTTGGSTGDHLHFQIDINGTPVNPCHYMTVGKGC